MTDPDDALFPTRHTSTPEMPSEDELDLLEEEYQEEYRITYAQGLRLIAAVRALQVVNRDLCNEYRENQAELAELRRDAERWRWARDPENGDHEAWKELSLKGVPAAKMDALVDAALASPATDTTMVTKR